MKGSFNSDSRARAADTTLRRQNLTFKFSETIGTEHLRSLDEPVSDRNWVVGDAGTILLWNGTEWITKSSPTANDLRGVMDDLTTGVIVGFGGTILNLNQTTLEWTEDGQSGIITTKDLYDILVWDTNVIIAVGQDGTIIRFDGVTWSVISSGTANTLFSIDWDVNGDFWVVGNNGTILKSTDLGVTWSSITSPVTQRLTSVWMSIITTSEGWIVGNNGTILRWNGTAWNPFSSPVSETLHNVFTLADLTGLIVGNSGVILSFDGNDWIQAKTPTNNAITSGGTIFLIGAGGTILRNYSDTYPSLIVSGGNIVTPLAEEQTETQILTNLAILDNLAHNSSIFNSSRYKYNTFFVENTLDQVITVQIMANRVNSTTGAVTVGLPFTVAATTGIEARTKTVDNDGYLPYYYIVVTAAVAPVSGTVNAYAIGRN